MPKSDLKIIDTPNPRPLYKGTSHQRYFQNGITDPMWPTDYDGQLNPKQYADYLKALQKEGGIRDDKTLLPNATQLKAKYKSDYAGRVSKQGNISILRANMLSSVRQDLIDVLKLLTKFAVDEMEKTPSLEHLFLLEQIPDSYRLTVTIGLGSTLFIDGSGTDRFGLRAKKPKYLKEMPRFEGDDTGFDPAKTASDFMILICSDHPYVNVAVARFFIEFFNKKFREFFSRAPDSGNMLEFLSVEEGFQRKDKREFLKFDDGIDNLNMGSDELERHVYVEETDNEPDWCVDGAYMVYRKIRENMPTWEAIKDSEQEKMIGRRKKDGAPLSRKTAGPDNMLPVYTDPTDAADGPLNAHVRKVQPRRQKADLFGVDDLERRFLRRPYPFFDGIDNVTGNTINGLQFLGFMKSIQLQFEHITNMWQLNPDFPVKGAGIDALFDKDILKVIDGGYYFCPPGLKSEDDYFGSGMFENGH